MFSAGRELFKLLAKAPVFRLTAGVVERHAFADTVAMTTQPLHFASSRRFFFFTLSFSPGFPEAMPSTSSKRHFGRLPNSEATVNKFIF
ncbi:hypothetical protein JTE90_005832 [Oedothorax gibbosus]|uniref:Uncharacterized protein n=1 Tax=Oedothorax gibbosus TaxID=931172 RepID=A0AAV6V505_9ARAC|nr:hypothetical protein JTE90_005832 [Oedothorax gibbosus]